MGGGEIDYIYNYLPGGKLPNHIVSILTTLGINLQQLKRVDSVTQYNNIYVPDNSIILNNGIRYYTEEYKSTIQRIVNTCNHDIKLDSGIYLTRTSINDGKDYGEKSIENLFRDRGYQIISPEKLSFSEQVNMMNHCSDIVTTEGSLSHNALFLKKGSKLTVLRKADFFNGYQLMINQMNQLDVTYIDANHTIKRQKTPWAGPFFLWQTSSLNHFLNIDEEKIHWLSVLWYKYLVSVCYNNLTIYLNTVRRKLFFRF